MASSPKLLGQLLSETFEFCKAHWQSLLTGVVIFGVVLGVVSSLLGAKVAYEVREGVNDMGINTERMEELSGRVEAGDEAAMAELQALLEAEFGGLSDEEAAQKMYGPMVGMMKGMLPAIGLSMIVMLIISFFAHAYYVLVAVEGKDVNGTMSRATNVMLPLVGLSIWTFLRTFIWIPIIGFIPAIILGPRFIAAPVIFLTERKGVMASVSDSYKRTRGYWAKIVGNAIVMAIILIIASIVLQMVLGVLLTSIPMALMVVMQIMQQLFMAIMTVFIIKLSQTVLQNPR